MNKIVVFFLGILLLFSHLLELFGVWDATTLFVSDKAMHFLGGLCAASFFLVFFRDLVRGTFKHPAIIIRALLLPISFTALIGILWEFYEYFLLGLDMEVSDLIYDLFFDVLGGFVVAFIYVLRPWTSSRAIAKKSEVLD